MTITLELSGMYADRVFEGCVQMEYDEAMAFVWMLRRMTPSAVRAMAVDDSEARRMIAAGTAIKATVENMMVAGRSLSASEDQGQGYVGGVGAHVRWEEAFSRPRSLI